MRQPAASTPMSRIDTPASFNAARAASEARSTMSLSACLPNFVIVIPRIQTGSAFVIGRPCHFAVGSHVSSLKSRRSVRADRFVAETDGLDAVLVGTDRI